MIKMDGTADLALPFHLRLNFQLYVNWLPFQNTQLRAEYFIQTAT